MHGNKDADGARSVPFFLLPYDMDTEKADALMKDIETMLGCPDILLAFADEGCAVFPCTEMNVEGTAIVAKKIFPDARLMVRESPCVN